MSDKLSERHTVPQIEARMLNGAEFTFKGLCDRYGEEHYRLIDRTIQKLRRAGKISYRREGRDFIWSAVNDR
jgi:hypothetical protein